MNDIDTEGKVRFRGTAAKAGGGIKLVVYVCCVLAKIRNFGQAFGANYTS